MKQIASASLLLLVPMLALAQTQTNPCLLYTSRCV